MLIFLLIHPLFDQKRRKKRWFYHKKTSKRLIEKVLERFYPYHLLLVECSFFQCHKTLIGSINLSLLSKDFGTWPYPTVKKLSSFNWSRNTFNATCVILIPCQRALETTARTCSFDLLSYIIEAEKLGQTSR